MPLSTDPTRREKQLANLQPAGRATHGATSERKLAPLRAKHRADLVDRFPGIDQHRLRLLCDLLARIDLATEFVDVHGLMKNTRQTHPVLDLLARWEHRAWNMLSQLEPKGGTSDWSRDTPILQIELTAAERLGLLADNWKTRTAVAHRILRRLSDERVRGKKTSLRHSSLNMQAAGQPPTKLDFRDLTDDDLAKLKELEAQLEAEAKTTKVKK